MASTSTDLTASLAGIPLGSIINLQLVINTLPGYTQTTHVTLPGGSKLIVYPPNQLFAPGGTPVSHANALAGNAIIVFTDLVKAAAATNASIQYILTAGLATLTLTPTNTVPGGNPGNQEETFFTTISFK